MLKIIEDVPHAHAMPSVSLSTFDDADAFIVKVKEAGFGFVRFELSDMARSRGKTIPVGDVGSYTKSGLDLTEARSCWTVIRYRCAIPATAKK
jgi:glutamine synthetase